MEGSQQSQNSGFKKNSPVLEAGPPRLSEAGYISLADASHFTPHSQEYLSLRVRQGKLRAVKLGRNWVTKKEWVEEYLSKSNVRESALLKPDGGNNLA